MFKINYCVNRTRCFRRLCTLKTALFLLCCMSLAAYAQVNTYTFSQSSATYSPIGGGTILGTATAASGAASLDDINYPVTLPFSFNFNGTGYTSITVNTNGFVAFGTAPSASTYSPISGTGTYSGCAAAVGRDLNGNYNGIVTGEIAYEIQGTAPNRTCVIQWAHFRPYSTSADAINYWDFNFQIRLNETSNVIDFSYDMSVAGAPTSGTAQVGLRGANNTFNPNVLNRLITPGTHTWATSVAGVSNVSNCGYNTTLLPTSGQVFTFSPPAACTNPPTPGTASSSVSAACTGTAFNVILTGYSGGFGQTYQWQSSPDGSAWSDVAGATTTTSSVSQAAATYYRCNVTCGTTTTSTTVYVPMELPLNCYCTPPYTTGCDEGDYIGNITFAGINNTTTCALSPYYTYYSGVTANVFAGSTYPINLTFGYASQRCKIWIDLNDNGVFTDTGEEVFNQPASGTTISGTVTIPGNAPAGTHRMRVRCVYSNTTFTSCSSQTYGETEDYDIDISVPTCTAPYSLSATNIAMTSADLTWSGSGQGTYVLEWGTAGFVYGTGTVVNPATSPVSLTGLSAGTNYSFYVYQDCGGGDLSTVSGPSNFQTQNAGEMCSTAPVVSTYPDSASISITVVTSGATQDGPVATCSAGSGNTPDDDIWYQFVAPNTPNKLRVRTYPGSSSDWVMEVWDNCPGSGNKLACSDDVNSLMPMVDLCDLVAGNTYYVRLWTYSTGAAGRTCSLAIFETATPCPVPPANDQCSNAIPLTLGVPQAGTTTNASAGANPSANCDMFASKNDVWYTVNPGNNVALRFEYAVNSGTIEANFSMDCNAADLGVCYSPVPAVDTIYGFPLNTNIYMRMWSNPGSEGDFTVTVSGICDNPTATISGGGSVCDDGSVLPDLSVALTGTSPWSIILTNGTINDTISSITTSPHVIVAPDSGTWTVAQVTDAYCLGTPSGSANVIINPLPVVSASANTVCSGGTLQLTGTSDDPNSGYMWSGPNGFSSGDQNPTIPNMSSSEEGDYILTVLSFTTNCTNTDTVSVTLGVCNVCPTATNLSSRNVSAYSATLDWDFPTGYPYSTPDSVVTYFRLVGAIGWQRRVWTDIDSIRIYKLTPDRTYEWKIVVFCNGTPMPQVFGSNFTTDVACVPASNLSATGITTSQATISWDAASIADSFYVIYRKTGGLWLFKNTLNTSETLTGLAANSTYEVKIKTFCSTGASTGYATMGTFNTASGKANDLNIGIAVYPNPMRDVLTVEITPITDTHLNVAFVNVLGSTVKRYQESVKAGSSVREISVSDLENGVYMVEISYGEIRRVIKIVKE